MPTTGKQLFTTLAPDGKLTVEVADSQFSSMSPDQGVKHLNTPSDIAQANWGRGVMCRSPEVATPR